MRKTLIAMANLLVAAPIAIFMIVVPLALLGGDERGLYVMALVFVGTVAGELTSIAGAIRTTRYRVTERRIAMSSRNEIEARFRILMWATTEYRKEFYRKLPRYWLRLISWVLLAVAGLWLAILLLMRERTTKHNPLR